MNTLNKANICTLIKAKGWRLLNQPVAFDNYIALVFILVPKTTAITAGTQGSLQPANRELNLNGVINTLVLVKETLKQNPSHWTNPQAK